jgi:hypothetical protein
MSKPFLVHHTMVTPILREYAERNNDDQFRMLTWNGVAVEGAEDDNFGVQTDYPHTPSPELNWTQMMDDGEIVEKYHPSLRSLEMARTFFSRPIRYGAIRYKCWSFSPVKGAPKGSSILDMFVTNMISFHYLLDLISRDQLPLLGVIKSLRDLQAAVKSPVYLFCEVEGTVAPEFMIKAFKALPEESKQSLTTEGEDDNLFEEVVNLNVVADFLVAMRAFKGWLRNIKRGKKRTLTRF